MPQCISMLPCYDARALLAGVPSATRVETLPGAYRPTTKHRLLILLTIVLACSGLLVWCVEAGLGSMKAQARSPLTLHRQVPIDTAMHRSAHTSSGRLNGALWARGLWTSYNRALTTKPLATKIMTGVIGTILGDVIAQYSAYRLSRPSTHTWTTPGGVSRHETTRLPFTYDVPRLVRLLLWSASVGTPLAHHWFNFLDKNVMPRTPRHPLSIAAKLVLDQGVMAPLGTAMFFAAMKALEGQPHLAVHEVRTKLWPVMQANWLVWPLANAINFAIIPPSQRILYVNILSVAWSAFMSHMASSPAQRTPHITPLSNIQLRSIEPTAAKLS